MKVAVIGIDGFDPVLFERFRGELPTLDRIAREGVFSPLRSVVPPDSVPAWCSIYTGLTPPEHGILHSFNYLDRKKDDFRPDVGFFQGKTFWDRAGNAGRRVLILNPFMAYPAWDVHGIMVSGPVFEGGEVSTRPETVLEDYEFPPLGGIVDFPTKKNIPEFVEKTRKLTEDQAEIFRKLAAEKPWDLFFATFLTFDRLGHFTWRFTDPEDPTYPGPTSVESTIRDAYRQYDRIVGSFMEILPPETALLIISDHGHGRRCTRVFNVNEFLRQKGYLASKVKGRPLLSKHYWLEVAKVKTLEFFARHELEDFAFKIVKWIPNRKALKKSTHITSVPSSLAHSPDFDGTNPTGGINVSRRVCEERKIDYNGLREELIGDLLQLRDPKTGEPIFRWIKKREEVYRKGGHLDEFPEILFELKPEYGVSWNLHTGLYGINTTHRKISGGHRPEGVLFGWRTPKLRKEKPSVLDLAPSILSLLEVPFEEHSGEVLFR
jgi:predicted AlkP superfamily phosphohydrolase/phosphomutase